MKKFVLSLIISCGAITASALPNVNNLRDTITDNNIVAPHSFEASADSLAKNWYYQQYVTLSAPKEENINARTIDATPSDELYIQRLQYLQNEGGFTIEMPYNSVVKSYIEMYTGKRRRSLVEKMLGMWLYYEPIFETALLKEKIPTELKYLPIIESALNPNAVSPAAAAGLWQFIPSTGKGMGLEINSLVDERRDTYKASQKAAEFLKQLYNTYGDWSLAIAAYNCGPGNVNKAIRRAGGGKKDFWEIYNFLPKETRGYVPAFIAAAYVMNFHNEHGISTSLAKKPLVTDTVQVKRRINFKQIADIIDIDVKAIEALNPQYLKNTIPAGPTKPYTLILPSKYCYMYVMSEDIIGTKDAEKYTPRERAEPGKKREDPKPATPKEEPKAKKEELQANTSSTKSSTSSSSESSNYQGYTSKEDVVMHEVKSGETLKSIANKYGTNTSRIKKDNNLTSNVVSRGQTLKITTYKKVLSDEANNTTVATKSTKSSSNNTSTSTKSYSSNTSTTKSSSNNYSYNTQKTDNAPSYKTKKKKSKKNTYTAQNYNTQNAYTAQSNTKQATTPSYKSKKKQSSTKSLAQVDNKKSKSSKNETVKNSKKSSKKSTVSSTKSKTSTVSKDKSKKSSKSKSSIASTSKSKKSSSKNLTSSKSKKATADKKSSKSKDSKKTTSKSSTKSKDSKKATTSKKSTKDNKKTTTSKKSSKETKKSTSSTKSSKDSKKSTASKSKAKDTKKSTSSSKSSSSKKSSSSSKSKAKSKKK